MERKFVNLDNLLIDGSTILIHQYQKENGLKMKITSSYSYKKSMGTNGVASLKKFQVEISTK